MLENTDLRGAILDDADVQDAVLTGSDIRDARMERVRNLTREQVLSCRDWRGALLPQELRQLEVPSNASEEDMIRRGRTWVDDKGRGTGE